MKLEDAFDSEDIVLEDKKTAKKSIKTIYSPKYREGKIFAPLSNAYLVAMPEEIVRQDFICKLVNEYGYSLTQMAQEIKLTNSSRGTGAARADLVIWRSHNEKQKNKTAFLVVELKADYLKLKVEDCYQGYNYATWSRAKLFAISNGKELQVYKTIEEELPLKLQPVNDIPLAKDILDSKKLENALAKTKEFTGDEFAKLLHKCHNIIRNNDKLSPEASFDEISKILFIKIMYERNPKQEAIFSFNQFERLKTAWNLSRGKSEKEGSYMQRLFEDVKDEFSPDGIFDSYDKIKLRERSFEQIVKELEVYNLTSTSSDVKGIAFERFLGKTFRGELGQFFTPRVIVDFIIDLLEPTENELVCDPCAGSGGFLIRTFESIKNNIDKEYIEIKKNKQKEIFGSKLELLDDTSKQAEYENYLKKKNTEQEERITKLSHKSIFGTDANPRMARVSKMNMIMHGDGHNGIHHNDGLLNVNGIFRNRFDVIITNPPFGTNLSSTSPTVEEDDKYKNEEMIQKYVEEYGDIYLEEMKQVTNNIDKPIRNLFKTGATTGATEVLFIERCIDLLKPGGRLGIVLPEGVLNSTNLQNARELFESRAKILLVVSLPQDIFASSGATVKTSLVFFKKFTVEENNEYKALRKESKDIINKKYDRDLEIVKKPLELILAKIISVKTKIKELDLDKKTDILVIKKQIANLKSEEKMLIVEKRIEQKEQNKKQKVIDVKITEESKALLKEKFNYSIPISEIKNAGITSTGAAGANDLPKLLEMFKVYRTKNNIWEDKK
jgi:type I restriction enzyme M protein